MAKAKPDNRCAHCREPCVMFGRGLCHTCFYVPGIRRQYRAKKADRKMSAYNIEKHPLPSFPTQHDPKTAKGRRRKVLVLIKRAARREQLWHPDDAKDGD